MRCHFPKPWLHDPGLKRAPTAIDEKVGLRDYDIDVQDPDECDLT